MNIREPLVNIGFIGYGYWGPNVLRNLYQNPRAQVLIACDSSPQQNALLHEHYPTVEITANHEDVFNNPNIDAVCITTPAATHYALVKQALEAGKHVFVEKPMCSTVAEADTLISCAEQHDRILMVGHVYKYNKAVDIIKEVIDQGELGKIHYVRAIRTSLGPRIRADVNVVWDYAIHDLYIAMYLFGGRPERVRASGKSCLRSGIEDVVVIKTAGSKSKNKIYIIQQIDRMIDLEEVAEQKGWTMDTLLEEMEIICYSGTKLNIDYYLEQIMDDEKLDDIMDYFMNAESDNIDDALEEFEDEDVIDEDLRLVRIKFLSEYAN